MFCSCSERPSASHATTNASDSQAWCLCSVDCMSQQQRRMIVAACSLFMDVKSDALAVLGKSFAASPSHLILQLEQMSDALVMCLGSCARQAAATSFCPALARRPSLVTVRAQKQQ